MDPFLSSGVRNKNIGKKPFQSNYLIAVMYINSMRFVIFSLFCMVALGAIFSQSSTVKIHPNCFSSTQNGECTECMFGFVLRDGVCKKVRDNCKTFNPRRGICTSCYVGYALSPTFTCEVDPDAQTSQGCSRKFNQICLECSKGYYFNYEGNCEPIQKGCHHFDYEKKTCMNCLIQTTYRANTGECTRFELGDRRWISGCTGYVGELCTRCQNGKHGTSGYCWPGKSSCRLYDPANPSHCKACFQGFVLFGNACLAVNQNYLCKRYGEDGKCVQCQFKTIMNAAGVCVAADPVCKTHDINGRCTSCHPGYTLTATTCVVNQNFEVNPLCRLWSNNECISCNVWAVKDKHGICRPVNNLCRQYQADGGCSQCYGGYRVTYRHTCVPISNLPCQSFTPDGLCESCIFPINYKLEMGICEIDFDYCTKRDKFGRCVSCYKSHYLQNGTCVEIAPECEKFDYQKKICTLCNFRMTADGNNCVRPLDK